MLAVLGGTAPKEIFAALKSQGMEIISLPPHPALPSPVASHADLLVFFDTTGIFTTASYAEIASRELDKLSACLSLPLRICREELSGHYPKDILLDALPLGQRLLCRADSTAELLLSLPNRRIISTAQGYAKCNALPITQKALVTSDPSIANVCNIEKLEYLCIQQGAICLPGYDTGFIGGASSFAPLHSLKEIYFCGNLLSHPDGQRIAAFCTSHGKEPVSLSNLPLTDIGTLFLFQNNT